MATTSTEPSKKLLTPPIWITELELTEPIQNLVLPIRKDSVEYQGARLLVRIGHYPIGYVELVPSQLEANAIANVVWETLGPKINNFLAKSNNPIIDSLTTKGLVFTSASEEKFPFISVVMCTRNRTEGAKVTIDGLLKMEYSSFEVVVVDNASSSDSTKQMVKDEFGADERVRYVSEPRPGLSCARNRGIAEATGDIVAFTDDDVCVDEWWLQGIARGFNKGSNVGLVAGLIPTAEIENEMQLYFDQRVTWGWNCESRIFDLVDNRDDSVLYPYAAGIFGTGANFAIRRDVAKELDGFDEALGAGSPVGGGEDLDIFVRNLLAGYVLVYEPSAIISHVHRVEIEELNKQMITYGSGCSAFITKFLFHSNRTRVDLLRRVVPGILHVRKINKRTAGVYSLPSGLAKREMIGMLYGPLAYFKGIIRIKQMAKKTANSGN